MVEGAGGTARDCLPMRSRRLTRECRRLRKFKINAIELTQPGKRFIHRDGGEVRSARNTRAVFVILTSCKEPRTTRQRR